MLDGEVGSWRWNLRAGASEGRVAEAQGFVGVAAGRAAPVGQIGAAAGWLDINAAGSAWQTEIFWRLPLAPYLHLAPDIQWLRLADGEVATVVGIRVNALWVRP